VIFAVNTFSFCLPLCWNHFICVVCLWSCAEGMQEARLCIQASASDCLDSGYIQTPMMQFNIRGERWASSTLCVSNEMPGTHFHDATEGDPCECEIYHICLFECRNNPSCADSASRRKRPLNVCVCVCVCGVSACEFVRAGLPAHSSNAKREVCVCMSACVFELA
jgi:hypothetical protein